MSVGRRSTRGRRRRSNVGAETGVGGRGGAFKSGRSKKKAIRAQRTDGSACVCVYACMRGRDTRPLYEQYLMDCIGRAQTLNLTFTIIAALRGGAPARGRADGRAGGPRAGATESVRRDRTMLDVNFIIPGEKVTTRYSSSPSDRFSRSFCDVSPLPRSSRGHCTFHFEFFLARNIILSSVCARPSLISPAMRADREASCILHAFAVLSPPPSFAVSLLSIRQSLFRPRETENSFGEREGGRCLA